MKTKQELANEYMIDGDDVDIMYLTYENFINFDDISSDDAEELVYCEMANYVDYVANADDVLNYLCDTGIQISNYTQLKSGNYAININI